MRNKKVTMKQVVAAVLTVALLGTSIYFMPQTDVSAEDAVIQVPKQSYGAWKEVVPENGSFEAGEVGMDAYGWELLPATNAGEVNTNKDAIKTYLSNVSLKTYQEDNGNKVAEFKKNGPAYMFVKSQDVSVKGNATYRFAMDFCIREIAKIDPDSESNNYVENLRIDIVEVDAEGTETVTKAAQGGTAFLHEEPQAWDSFYQEFTTAETTENVYIRFFMAYNGNIKATIWFDNAELKEINGVEVYNSQFDRVQYYKNRSTGAYEKMNFTGWNLVSTTDGGSLFNDNKPYTGTKQNNYVVGAVEEVGRGTVATITRGTVSSGGSGTVIMQSDYIPVQVGDVCDFVADYKLLCYNADGTLKEDGRLLNGIGMVLGFYDSGKTLVQDDTAIKCSTSKPNIITTTGTTKTNTNNDWARLVRQDITIPEGAAYVKIGLFAGGTQNATASGSSYTMYFDNASITVNGSEHGYVDVQEWAGNYSRKENYGIRKVDEGSGYEDALQLYVTHPTSYRYGSYFFGPEQLVETGKEYRLELDMKIQNRQINNNTNDMYGEDIVIRYKDENHNVLTSTLHKVGTAVTPYHQSLNSSTQKIEGEFNTKDFDWTHLDSDDLSSFIVPADAKYVEIGFYIGHGGASGTTINSDLTHTFANITIGKVTGDEALWAEYAKQKEIDLFFIQYDSTGDDVEVLENILKIKRKVNDLNDVLGEGAPDMNKNNYFTKDDATILRWKLTGVQNSTELDWRQAIHW